MAKKILKEEPTDVEFIEVNIPETNRTGNVPEITFDTPIETKPTFLNVEILYEVTNPERNAFDFTDAIIKLETISAVENVSPERLEDFGITLAEIEEHEISPEKCCLIYSSAYPDGVIILDMEMEELLKILI